MKDELLLLSEDDICTLLTPQDVLSAVDRVFHSCARGDALYAPAARILLDPAGRNFCMSFLTGLRDLGVAGVKWFSGYGAPRPGFPFSHGSTLLLADLETGSPFSIMGSGTITAMRTAGGHCVIAAKYLSNPEPETLCVIGSGVQARCGIQGFLCQFPSLRTLRLWCRPGASRDRLLSMFRDQIQIELCETPEYAVRQADIVLTATTSADILVRAEWITPGTTLVCINAFVDLDPALGQQADKWVLGSHKEDTRHILDADDLRHQYPLNHDMVWADMPEIVSGQKPGRERENEIIVCTHMGMGFFDLACGKLAYERAVAKGIGQHFVLDSY